MLLGCEEGVFPHSRSIEEGNLEEERRLMYVGVTRAMRQLTISYARRRTVFGVAQYGMRSRFVDEIPLELTDRADEPVFAPGPSRSGARNDTSWGRRDSSSFSGGLGGGGSAAAVAPPAALSFRLGDDVRHVAFGLGVVTGVEPGGIVVVRFADDGSERKLMAEYAPVTKV
jgi:DNA helicase II / ATP-dependent DNA helicase PcrA